MNSAMAVSNKTMSKITIQARMRIIPVLDLQLQRCLPLGCIATAGHRNFAHGIRL